MLSFLYMHWFTWERNNFLLFLQKRYTIGGEVVLQLYWYCSSSHRWSTKCQRSTHRRISDSKIPKFLRYHKHHHFHLKWLYLVITGELERSFSALTATHTDTQTVSQTQYWVDVLELALMEVKRETVVGSQLHRLFWGVKLPEDEIHCSHSAACGLNVCVFVCVLLPLNDPFW